jgi:hypothetical protein
MGNQGHDLRMSGEPIEGWHDARQPASWVKRAPVTTASPRCP